jgi:hypothetical protein
MLSRGIRSGGIPSLARIRGSAVGSFFPRQKVSRCSVTPATRRMFAGVNGKVAVFQLFPAHSSMYLTDERAKLLYFVRCLHTQAQTNKQTNKQHIYIYECMDIYTHTHTYEPPSEPLHSALEVYARLLSIALCSRGADAATGRSTDNIPFLRQACRGTSQRGG